MPKTTGVLTSRRTLGHPRHTEKRTVTREGDEVTLEAATDRTEVTTTLRADGSLDIAIRRSIGPEQPMHNVARFVVNPDVEYLGDAHVIARFSPHVSHTVGSL